MRALIVATETKMKTKELIRPIPLDWWLKRPSYTQFMLRDFTSVFIAAYCVFLVVLMYRAEHADADAFRAFYQSLGSPLSVVLHLIALAFAVYHSVTFFNLTPRVIVLFRGDERVPDAVVAGMHFALWAVLSVILLVIALVA
jgi:fumarate reductase subunit C